MAEPLFNSRIIYEDNDYLVLYNPGKAASYTCRNGVEVVRHGTSDMLPMDGEEYGDDLAEVLSRVVRRAAS